MKIFSIFYILALVISTTFANESDLSEGQIEELLHVIDIRLAAARGII